MSKEISEKIYNPFNNEMVELKYAARYDYQDADKKVLENILSTKNNEYRQIQLIEFIHRAYARKQVPLLKKDIKEKLDFLYTHIENCFKYRYSFEVFYSQESLNRFLSFFAEVKVAERRIMVGMKQSD